MSRIIGINRTQDASVCLLDDGNPTLLQKERITRRKHDWGRLGDLPRYAERLKLGVRPVDLVVECYSSDAEVENQAAYADEIRAVLGPCEHATISHHLAHAYSAFFPSGFTDAAVLVVDCQGSPVRDFREQWSAPDAIDPGWLEVNSMYDAEGMTLRCVAKQLWDGDRGLPVGLGFFYLLLTQAIFPDGEGQEGKVMGMAPYGDPMALDLPDLVVEDHSVFLTPEWAEVLLGRSSYQYSGDDRAQFQRAADLAAAGQAVFETALVQVARWLHATTGRSRLCFAGGTALNCVANGRLLRETPFREIFVPPSPHDGGTALGCALFGAIALRGERPDFIWKDDFLGPDPGPASPSSLREQEDLIVEQPENLAERTAEALQNGQVIGTFHGRSESGPRALGHRSMLADARSPGATSWINQHVKGREWFRPLAPLVLLEHASEIFETDRALPFMQFAAAVRADYRAKLPAITHVDGSARIQTVDRATNPFAHDILSAFHRRTGMPVLINTSLNGPGGPLVETFEEALALFRTSPLHALVAPPYFIRKRVAPPFVPGA